MEFDHWIYNYVWYCIRPILVLLITIMSTTFLGNHLRVRYAFMVCLFRSLSTRDANGQATHVALILFLLFFTLFTTKDFYLMMWHLCSAGMVLIYLLPAFILSLRNRESGYERGWVELFYLTYQILWSWGMSILLTQREMT